MKTSVLNLCISPRNITHCANRLLISLLDHLYIKSLILLFCILFINCHHHRRYDLLDIEDSQLTLPWMARHQRRLVTRSGTLEALGTIKQLPNGSIDTHDFGQNIHDKGEGIMPWEKDLALDRMRDQFLDMLANIIVKEIRVHVIKRPARKVPVVLL